MAFNKATFKRELEITLITKGSVGPALARDAAMVQASLDRMSQGLAKVPGMSRAAEKALLALQASYLQANYGVNASTLSLKKANEALDRVEVFAAKAAAGFNAVKNAA